MAVEGNGIFSYLKSTFIVVAIVEHNGIYQDMMAFMYQDTMGPNRPPWLFPGHKGFCQGKTVHTPHDELKTRDLFTATDFKAKSVVSKFCIFQIRSGSAATTSLDDKPTFGDATYLRDDATRMVFHSTKKKKTSSQPSKT